MAAENVHAKFVQPAAKQVAPDSVHVGFGKVVVLDDVLSQFLPAGALRPVRNELATFQFSPFGLSEVFGIPP